MSAVVILLMFLAVMMMVRNIEAEREHQQIAATDSSEMRPRIKMRPDRLRKQVFNTSSGTESTVMTVLQRPPKPNFPGRSWSECPAYTVRRWLH